MSIEAAVRTAEELYVAGAIEVSDLEQLVGAALRGASFPGVKGWRQVADALSTYELRGGVDCIAITVRL